MIKKIGVTDDQRSKIDVILLPAVYLRDQSQLIREVMADILQSRYLRRRVVHKQLARTSLSRSKNGVQKIQVWVMSFIYFTRTEVCNH